MKPLHVHIVTMDKWILGDFAGRLAGWAPDDIHITHNRIVDVRADVLLFLIENDAIGQPAGVLSKSIIYLQSWYEPEPARSLQHRRKALESCAVVACANATYINALEMAGVRGSRLVQLGVDQLVFNPEGDRPRCDSADDTMRVIISGRHYPDGYKGDDARRRIMEELKGEAVFVFMGARWDETELPWASSKGIECEYMPRDQFAWPDAYTPQYRKAHVMLVTSRCEGGPAAPLEALACGCPVVSTPVGRMPELIMPGVNGTLVPFLPVGNYEMDTEQAVHAIRRWSRSPIDARTIASTVQSYTWTYWTNAFYELFREVGRR